MRPVAEARVVAGIGLDGDRHARAESRRQILLISKETLDALGVPPGAVKENLTIQGLDVMRLREGDRVRVGGEAVLEVTTVCDPCERMDEIRAGLRGELEGRRGMNTVAFAGGTIRPGDPVRVEQRAEARREGAQGVL
jgi:MOSC domain-containing protein YiiM